MGSKPRDFKGVWSSDTDEWATPDDLFNRLNSEFRFNLDACATSDNAKCDDFFTKEQNGLIQSWAGRRVWCNPPYSRAVGGFIKKAFLETTGGGIRHYLRLPSSRKNRYGLVAGLRNEGLGD